MLDFLFSHLTDALVDHHTSTSSAEAIHHHHDTSFAPTHQVNHHAHTLSTMFADFTQPMLATVPRYMLIPKPNSIVKSPSIAYTDIFNTGMYFMPKASEVQNIHPDNTQGTFKPMITQIPVSNPYVREQTIMLNQIAHEPKTPAGGMYAPDYWHPKVVLSYPQKGMVTVKLFKAGNTNPIWNQEFEMGGAGGGNSHVIDNQQAPRSWVGTDNKSFGPIQIQKDGNATIEGGEGTYELHVIDPKKQEIGMASFSLMKVPVFNAFPNNFGALPGDLSAFLGTQQL